MTIIVSLKDFCFNYILFNCLKPKRFSVSQKNGMEIVVIFKKNVEFYGLLEIITSQMCVHLLCRALTTTGMRNSAAREQRHYGKFYLKACFVRVAIISEVVKTKLFI